MALLEKINTFQLDEVRVDIEMCITFQHSLLYVASFLSLVQAVVQADLCNYSSNTSMVILYFRRDYYRVWKLKRACVTTGRRWIPLYISARYEHSPRLTRVSSHPPTSARDIATLITSITRDKMEVLQKQGLIRLKLQKD